LSVNHRGLIAAARIFSTFEGPTDGSEYVAGDVAHVVNGDIKFESCSFSYPARPDFPIFYKSPTVNGVNLSVADKESIGLVGRSGCGKSTILQVVMRFYKIIGGSATLDGREFSDLNVDCLRKQIGYVGQLPTLFNGTVRQNILLGKADASEAEIVAACKAAHAHDFIVDLSDGYDTEVGPGGGLLSGGQKQRIAIARAIIRNPKILVLDEATAALDNESQKLVQLALDELQVKQPRTTLTVAHRLLTIKDCDKIAFLGDGGKQGPDHRKGCSHLSVN
jgi:ATP-binding cassette subfamily B (MDR/TAP) protein 1